MYWGLHFMQKMLENLPGTAVGLSYGGIFLYAGLSRRLMCQRRIIKNPVER